MDTFVHMYVTMLNKQYMYTHMYNINTYVGMYVITHARKSVLLRVYKYVCIHKRMLVLVHT